MKMILNLTSKNNSEFRYKISKFPDGQQCVDIENANTLRTDILRNREVTIKSRLNDFKDLELIISATASLKELGLNKIDLYIPYLLGGRSDRKFQEGGSNYIKSVIAPIINLQGYNKVTVYDPHSDVAEACINNFEKVTNKDLVEFALIDITNDIYSDDTTIISPDAGSLKKVFDVAQHYNRERVVIASKHRNLSTGEITHTEVPIIESDSNKFVIIDDICDGGRTFIEIAKVILEKRPKEKHNTKIYLIVSHGIFSKGFKELNKYFDGIYTTDSYFDMNNDSFTQQNDNKIHKLNQLNIFTNEY